MNIDIYKVHLVSLIKIHQINYCNELTNINIYFESNLKLNEIIY